MIKKVYFTNSGKMLKIEFSYLKISFGFYFNCRVCFRECLFLSVLHLDMHTHSIIAFQIRRSKYAFTCVTL